MKISIYIAMSANGFISNSRNVPDWLSNEYGEGLYAMCKEFNAVIMGKTTYNILAPDYLPLKDQGTTIVLTTDKEARSENPTVVFTQDNPSAIIRSLEARGYTKAVIIGGAMAIKEFINAGFIDDIYFVFEPVLFHTGLPLLKDVNLDFKLRLLEVKKLNENTVRLHYEFKK